MLFQPKQRAGRRIFRKPRKGRLILDVSNHASTIGTRKEPLKYGEFGLYVKKGGRISARQLEAARRTITRLLNRTGKVFIIPFPHKAITKKPTAVRMGKGKGAVDHWVCIIKPGQIIFEISGVTESQARNALESASKKIPIPTNRRSRFKVLSSLYQ